MKIVLGAFQNKLCGVMEVPEETGMRFKLVMTQPVQFKSLGFGEEKHALMDCPVETLCEFEYTGMTFMQKDHPWDGAKEYQLIDIIKRP
jgi:hypothetical protein